MEREDKILASEFCVYHNIELSFIHALSDHDMIVTEVVDDAIYLPVSELKLVEKIIHLHFELEINLEGIETIIHLLDRMRDMQGEIARLTNRLRVYEV
jgi:hypothetical protein